MKLSLLPLSVTTSAVATVGRAITIWGATEKDTKAITILEKINNLIVH